jgi:hypothetical protein
MPLRSLTVRFVPGIVIALSRGSLALLIAGQLFNDFAIILSPSKIYFNYTSFRGGKFSAAGK